MKKTIESVGDILVLMPLRIFAFTMFQFWAPFITAVIFLPVGMIMVVFGIGFPSDKKPST